MTLQAFKNTIFVAKNILDNHIKLDPYTNMDYKKVKFITYLVNVALLASTHISEYVATLVVAYMLDDRWLESSSALLTKLVIVLLPKKTQQQFESFYDGVLMPSKFILPDIYTVK